LFSLSNIPKTAKGEVLDKYLKLGFFRGGYRIFTTTFLQVEEELYNTHWLRINLNNFSLSKKQQDLFKRNSRFKTVLRPLEINEEKDALFSKYRAATPFIQSPSLFFLLHDFEYRNTYNSWELCIYDDNKLIGLGVLDLGKETCAGITSIFDPDYKKYSIGRYMILSKIFQAKQNNFDWFYPGYFTTNYKVFDYKLDLDYNNTEYYDFVKNDWQHISNFDQKREPLTVILKKMFHIEHRLHQNNLDYKVLKYKYFDCNLYIDFPQEIPLTQPYFIVLNESEITTEILYYNVMDEKYEILSCTKYYDVHDQKEIDKVYNCGILVIDKSSAIQFADAMEVLKFIKVSIIE
jgi:leucyl-tRNA---protein transferase